MGKLNGLKLKNKTNIETYGIMLFPLNHILIVTPDLFDQLLINRCNMLRAHFQLNFCFDFNVCSLNWFQCFSVFQNSTDDLEVRVTLLEDDVEDLQDEVEEVETDNTLQDERLNIMEDSINNNENDIDGILQGKMHA